MILIFMVLQVVKVLKIGLKQTLKMTENDKTKIAIRMEYCKLTGEYFLDNIAKYCDFLEFKLIQYENDNGNRRFGTWNRKVERKNNGKISGNERDIQLNKIDIFLQ